jgi:hypothetical protein
MTAYPWQSCHYYPDGCCPNRSLIDKAYLIPQLLPPSELSAVEAACATCEVCRRNRRKHRRVQRPLTVVILDERSGEELHGTTLNVSNQGALIKVADCKPFQVNREIELRLGDTNGAWQSSRAVIKRVERTRGVISVFLLAKLRREDRLRNRGSLSRRQRI